MPKKLTVALAEFDIIWENPKANLSFLETWLDTKKADLFVLPEMFATGFSMNSKKIAEPAFGLTFNWMQQMSIQKKSAICGSVPTKINNNYYNRFYFVNGSDCFYYDKKHLFSYGQESEFYKSGNQRVNVIFKGWKIRLIVCYDLRFPIWCRNHNNYDLLLCVANWPLQRIAAWKVLLQARAIENMSYCIGVNRKGKDGNGLKYCGESKAFGPLGEDLTKPDFMVELNHTELLENRIKYRFLEDQDQFELI